MPVSHCKSAVDITKQDPAELLGAMATFSNYWELVLPIIKMKVDLQVLYDQSLEIISYTVRKFHPICPKVHEALAENLQHFIERKRVGI